MFLVTAVHSIKRMHRLKGIVGVCWIRWYLVELGTIVRLLWRRYWRAMKKSRWSRNIWIHSDFLCRKCRGLKLCVDFWISYPSISWFVGNLFVLEPDRVKPIKLLLKQLVFILLIIIQWNLWQSRCALYFYLRALPRLRGCQTSVPGRSSKPARAMNQAGSCLSWGVTEFPYSVWRSRIHCKAL